MANGCVISLLKVFAGGDRERKRAVNVLSEENTNDYFILFELKKCAFFRWSQTFNHGANVVCWS